MLDLRVVSNESDLGAIGFGFDPIILVEDAFLATKPTHYPLRQYIIHLAPRPMDRWRSNYQK